MSWQPTSILNPFINIAQVYNTEFGGLQAQISNFDFYKYFTENYELGCLQYSPVGCMKLTCRVRVYLVAYFNFYYGEEL